MRSRIDGVAGMCREIRELSPGLWNFVRVDGVAPTNNAAEQALRHAVIPRKTSFGTHSEVGSRFLERVLTVVASLKRQGRDLLGYVAAALAATSRGDHAPRLVEG